MRTTDSQLSASNATGYFQKSEPVQLGISKGPLWNKNHEPNPKDRDMTSLLAEDLRGGTSMVLVELVKRISISADAYDIDCSNIIIYIHAYIINNVDVNRTAIAACTGTATSIQ